VPRGAEAERAGVAVQAPAGEGPRRLLQIGLAVAALAEGEELHQLARKVLVGRLLAAARVVEIDQHRRVARDGVQQVAEVAERVTAQQDVLAIEQGGHLHLGEAGGEVVVPEEGHHFGEGAGRHAHLGEPPGLQFAALLASGVAQGEAFGLAHAVTLWRQPVGIPCGWRRDGGAAGTREDRGDGLLAGQRCERLDLCRRAAETAARQQVAGLGGVERQRAARCSQRREHRHAAEEGSNHRHRRRFRRCVMTGYVLCEAFIPGGLWASLQPPRPAGRSPGHLRNPAAASFGELSCLCN